MPWISNHDLLTLRTLDMRFRKLLEYLELEAVESPAKCQETFIRKRQPPAAVVFLPPGSGWYSVGTGGGGGGGGGTTGPAPQTDAPKPARKRSRK